MPACNIDQTRYSGKSRSGTILGQFGNTLVIHCDDLAAAPDGAAARSPQSRHREVIDLYSNWAGNQAKQVFLLRPEHERPESTQANHNSISELWYSPDGTVTLPRQLKRSSVWVINGRQLPMVDWMAATAAHRRVNSDVVMFGSTSPHSKPHYPESVLVGASGEVVKLTRHYVDSPAFTDLWSGDASFLVATGKHAPAVLNHVIVRGWGLESIGGLTRRFSVRWSPTPCLLSGFALTTVDAPVGDATAASSPAPTPVEQSHAPTSVSRSADDPITLPDEYSDKPAGGLVYLFAKRTLDLVVSAAGLIALTPLLVTLAILVRATSHGPAMYGHQRQGLGGRGFKCWKFRSMRIGADLIQDELRGQNEVDGPQFKIAHDPRLTPIGSWLRRYNLDELPQLFNVLMGQMSFVGPRPSPDQENQLCPAWRRARLSLKPGITGLWQVMRLRNANASDFQEWIYYDVEYARHRCMSLDLQLLLHTPLSMFAPHRLKRFAKRLQDRGICAHSARVADSCESVFQPPV